MFSLSLILWVREVYNLAQTLSGPMARAEEVSCRGRVINGQGKGERLRSYPVLGTPELRGEDQHPSKAIPKQLPEGDVSGMGPTRRQSVKLDQGKGILPSVNAPANTQS